MRLKLCNIFERILTVSKTQKIPVPPWSPGSARPLQSLFGPHRQPGHSLYSKTQF